MSSINFTIITGHSGKDAEKYTFPDGNSQVTFSLATSFSWKDQKSGEKKERTDWHDIVCRGITADIAEKRVRKGTLVTVTGELRNRKRKTQSGDEVKVTEIHANRIVPFVAKGDTSDDVPFDTE